MKNLILISIAVLVSLITFSQETTPMEKLFLQKVNAYRISEGIDTLNFSPIAYKIGKDKSGGLYDGTILNLDTVLVKPYGVEGTQISAKNNLYDPKDGTVRTDEVLVNSVMDFWTEGIERGVYLLTHFDAGNGNLYDGAVATTLIDGLYYYTLVIHERIK
tara:strand:- start:155 stop:634 length:480 start_codon:yes stop_codon:yes gene_type:complete